MTIEATVDILPTITFGLTTAKAHIHSWRQLRGGGGYFDVLASLFNVVDVDRNDRSLRAIVQARTEDALETTLSTLIFGLVMPLAESEARRLFGKDTDSAEAVVTDVVCGFVVKMRALAKGETEPVRNVKQYVLQLVRSAVAKRLAALNPDFARLKRRIVYQLRHDPELACWRSNSGAIMCGLAPLANQDVRREARGLLLKIAPARAAEIALAGCLPDEVSDTQLVAALLAWIGSPILVSDLVKAVARLRGVSPPRLIEFDDPNVPDPIAPKTADLTPDERTIMVRLWTGLKALPLRQRTVILLQMRDQKGGDELDLLVLQGVTTYKEIADTLEMPWEEFAELWSELPLDDGAIAARLGVSVANVRQLRFQARVKLSPNLAEIRQ